MIDIPQGTSSVETLRIGSKDQDLHHSARYHPVNPPLTFRSTKTEAVDTSSGRRRTVPALVNTSHHSTVSALTSDHWRNLYGVLEAGITNQSPRVVSIACIFMILIPITDRREHLHKTPEVGTMGLCHRARSSIATIGHSGQKRPRRDPQDYIEVEEKRSHEQTERTTIFFSNRD